MSTPRAAPRPLPRSDAGATRRRRPKRRGSCRASGALPSTRAGRGGHRARRSREAEARRPLDNGCTYPAKDSRRSQLRTTVPIDACGRQSFRSKSGLCAGMNSDLSIPLGLRPHDSPTFGGRWKPTPTPSAARPRRRRGRPRLPRARAARPRPRVLGSAAGPRCPNLVLGRRSTIRQCGGSW
jgi:hypothetical protein